MRERFKDAEHYLRLALLFVAGFVVFLVVRAVLVPERFGEYGHFRPGSLEDNRDVALVFAGRQVCADCHEEVASTKQSGKHAGVGCEACHGPLARHAADPVEVAPELPNPVELCPVCHRTNAAKPAGFPQVDPEDHAGGASCGDCHDPHKPGFE